MALKAEGIFDCTVISARSGADGGIPTVQITVQIESGPNAGTRCTYEDRVDAQSIKYVRYSCLAVGWRGKSFATLEADAKAWIAATGGKSTVEIRHLEIKRGKNAGEFWDKVSGIGRGMPKPIAPIGGEALADADALLRDFDDAAGDMPADAPHAADTNTDDIPF